MTFYMDLVMVGKEFRRLPTELPTGLHGEVLELGIGIGLNL